MTEAGSTNALTQAEPQKSPSTSVCKGPFGVRRVALCTYPLCTSDFTVYRPFTELAVCSAELKVDVETAVPLLASPALPPPVTPAVPPPPSLPTLRLLLAFGVDDLGMKDEANGDPPLFAVAAGILVISTRSIDGE